MTDSKISQSTDITVNGNDNTVVANSKGAKINNDKKIKPSQHWLQILYWIVGIAVALIGIYKFFIE